MADVLLKTEKLSRKFAQGNTGNTVLNEVDIEIYQDDFTYINKLGGFFVLHVLMSYIPRLFNICKGRYRHIYPL